MDKIRRSSLYSLAGACALGGVAVYVGIACGPARPATYASSPGESASSRKPDGVLIEPPAALPTVQARAEARGVIALREPFADTAVRDVVKQFIEAFEHESIEELARLVTIDAGPIDRKVPNGRMLLFTSWRQRMMSVDYTELAGLEVYRPDRITTADYDELLPDERPVDMKEGDLSVKVPIETTHVGADKFFPDVVLMLLRREEGHYKIAGYGEADNP